MMMQIQHNLRDCCSGWNIDLEPRLPVVKGQTPSTALKESTNVTVQIHLVKANVVLRSDRSLLVDAVVEDLITFKLVRLQTPLESKAVAVGTLRIHHPVACGINRLCRVRRTKGAVFWPGRCRILSALDSASRSWVVVVHNHGCKWDGEKDATATERHHAVFPDLHDIVRDARDNLGKLVIVPLFEMCEEVAEVREEGIVVDQGKPFRCGRTSVVQQCNCKRSIRLAQFERLCFFYSPSEK